MIRKKTKPQSHRIFVTANHQIRFPQVRVLAENGEMVGVLPIAEALNQARLAEKDLVLVADKANPPVAKIIDLAKHKYQLQQKEAESRKNAKKQDLKEIRLTPFMGDNDFESRLKRIIEFLEKGDKVRLSLLFRGRVITKKEFGFEMVNRVIAATSDIAVVEVEPKLLGQKLIAQLMPSKKKPGTVNS